MNFKLEFGTRVIMPGFEKEFAFRNFTTMLAQKLGLSQISKTIQLELEKNLTSAGDEDFTLTKLQRLQYFRNNFRKIPYRFNLKFI